MHQAQGLLLRRTDTALAIMRPLLSDRWVALHHPMVHPERLFLSPHKIPMDHPVMVFHQAIQLPRDQLALVHLLVDQMLADQMLADQQLTVLLKAIQRQRKALLVLMHCHPLAVSPTA
jgi:hypothetical protein